MKFDTTHGGLHQLAGMCVCVCVCVRSVCSVACHLAVGPARGCHTRGLLEQTTTQATSKKTQTIKKRCSTVRPAGAKVFASGCVAKRAGGMLASVLGPWKQMYSNSIPNSSTASSHALHSWDS